MRKAEAKRDACSLVAHLIQQYLDAGQPRGDCIDGALGRHVGKRDKLQCDDCERTEVALLSIRNEMERRSGF